MPKAQLTGWWVPLGVESWLAGPGAGGRTRYFDITSDVGGPVGYDRRTHLSSTVSWNTGWWITGHTGRYLASAIGQQYQKGAARKPSR